MKIERFWAKVTITETCWLYHGYIDHNGYGCVNIRLPDRDTTQKAHVFAYKASGHEIPQGLELDHTCHARSCVRPSHMRLATHKQNAENRAGLYANNKSGHRGVFWAKRRNKWCAVVRHNNKHIHAGYFDDLQEAAEAARQKRLQLFTHNDKDKLSDRKQRGVLQGSGNSR